MLPAERQLIRAHFEGIADRLDETAQRHAAGDLAGEALRQRIDLIACMARAYARHAADDKGTPCRSA